MTKAGSARRAACANTAAGLHCAAVALGVAAKIWKVGGPRWVRSSAARRLSSEELMDRSWRAASGLASLGVGRGDTVAIYLRNDFPFFEASYAAGRVGAYATPVNWHYTEDEARYLFENSEAKVIVTHADLLGPAANYRARRCPGAGGGDTARSGGGLRRRSGPLQGPDRDDRLERPAGKLPPGPNETLTRRVKAIIYTSGTTGRPGRACAAIRRPRIKRTHWRDLHPCLRTRGSRSGRHRHGGHGPDVPLGAQCLRPDLRPGRRVGDPAGLLDPRRTADDQQDRVGDHLHMAPIMFNRLLKLLDEGQGQIRPQLAGARGPRPSRALPRADQTGDDRVVGAGDQRSTTGSD